MHVQACERRAALRLKGSPVSSPAMLADWTSLLLNYSLSIVSFAASSDKKAVRPTDLWAEMDRNLERDQVMDLWIKLRRVLGDTFTLDWKRD